jgi:hypothetical protein
MIKFNHHNGAMNSVVEGVIFSRATNPGKIGVFQVAFNLLESGFLWTIGKRSKVSLNQS